MAPKLSILSLLILLILTNPTANAEIDGDDSSLHLMDETLEWQLQSHFNLTDEEEEAEAAALQRRSLYWRSPAAPKRYYISYGALSANRVPCPPRSGRSYYTHNCYTTRGPVHPYNRGCSAITRCRR